MPGTKKYSPPFTVTTRSSGPSRNGESPGTVILFGGLPSCGPEQQVLIFAETEDVAAVQPLRLDELELPRDARLQAHEDDAAILAVVIGFRWQRLAVGDAAADESMTVDELAVEGQAVPRVHAADVRSDRAGEPVGIVAVAEGVVAVFVAGEGGIRPLGRELQRRAVTPATHDLGGQQSLAARIGPRRLGQLPAKRGDVLVQLAVHEKGAVRAERGRRRRRWKHALLVAVAEDELAGADRAPPVPPPRGALPGQR